jgi:hypothetical protein
MKKFLVAAIVATTSIVGVNSGAVHADSVSCHATTHGSNGSSTSCNKSSPSTIDFNHRAIDVCRNNTTLVQFNQYGPWKWTYEGTTNNWSTVDCPAGSTRINYSSTFIPVG